MVAAGARAEVLADRGAGASGDGTQGAGLPGAAGRRRRGDEAADRELRAAPADVDEKAPGVRVRVEVTGRSPDDVAGGDPRLGRAMRFEKWQALGNDYLILEASELPLELTAAARCCSAPHGVDADGARAGSRRGSRALRRTARNLQSRRVAAELSGNGARQAIMYLRLEGGPIATSSRFAPTRGRAPDDHGPGHLHCGHGVRVAELNGLSGGDAYGARRRTREDRLVVPARVDRQPAVFDSRRRPGRARGARPARSRAGDRSRLAVSRTARTSRGTARSPRIRSVRASLSAAWGRHCHREPVRPERR